MWVRYGCVNYVCIISQYDTHGATTARDRQKGKATLRRSNSSRSLESITKNTMQNLLSDLKINSTSQQNFAARRCFVLPLSGPHILISRVPNPPISMISIYRLAIEPFNRELKWMFLDLQLSVPHLPRTFLHNISASLPRKIQIQVVISPLKLLFY